MSYDPRIGWSITEPTDKLIEFIIEQGWSEISMSRNDGFNAVGIGGSKPNSGNGLPTSKPKGNSRKYQCLSCGCSVRATKTVHIICADCMKMMIEV